MPQNVIFLILITTSLCILQTVGTSGATEVLPGASWELEKPSEVGLNASKLDAFKKYVGGRGCVVRYGYAWVTRQGAWVALTNMTGMEFPFDALAAPGAREALWLSGKESLRARTAEFEKPSETKKPSFLEKLGFSTPAEPEAIVFIKGDDGISNYFQNDHWRETYITSDAGPAYRPGRDLYVLRPPHPDGAATPLTKFREGYVADVEVSWGGEGVIFARRREKARWWHIYEINMDGARLRQLTDGPYQDVGPAELPDGRIVFASSRIGMREEYHGYPALGL